MSKIRQTFGCVTLRAVWISRRKRSSWTALPATLGLSLRELPSAALRATGLAYGLSVVKAGALAERAGLRVGDIIYAVNEQRLHRIEDFTRFVANQPSGNLALLVRRGRSDFYVPVDLTSAAPRPPEGLPRFIPPSKDTLLRT